MQQNRLLLFTDDVRDEEIRSRPATETSDTILGATAAQLDQAHRSPVIAKVITAYRVRYGAGR
ncbi:hypothetical protein [Kitasatospora sp. NPDC001132]